MFKIVSNTEIAPKIFQMKILAPWVSKKIGPGQFIMLRVDEKGERIPLTVADHTDKNIKIVYQVVGVTTHKLSEKKHGEVLLDVVGPLGHKTDIKKIGTVCCIGGGVGIAELYPVVTAYKEASNKVIGIIGARDKESIIFKKELGGLCDELFITTDDGSLGEKGFVSDVLKRLIGAGIEMDLVYSVGPAVMMQVIADITKPHSIETIASLNTVLVDGTGMCGSCRIEVGEETKFVCVDGPEFNAHKVNFDELIRRQGLFKDEERHACKIKGIL